MLSLSVVSNSLHSHELLPTRLLCPWGFSRQEYCSGLSCPPPEDLPDPGIKPGSPTLQADSLSSEPPGKPVCLKLQVNKEEKAVRLCPYIRSVPGVLMPRPL